MIESRPHTFFKSNCQFPYWIVFKADIDPFKIQLISLTGYKMSVFKIKLGGA